MAKGLLTKVRIPEKADTSILMSYPAANNSVWQSHALWL